LAEPGTPRRSIAAWSPFSPSPRHGANTCSLTSRAVSETLVEQILAVVRLHLSEEQADILLGWLSRRLARPKALAAGDETLDRLRHVLEHWMSDAERAQFLTWLTRRVAAGESALPRRVPRP